MLCIISRSPEETLALGRWLGSRLRPGDFVALTGDLGTGKTALATGILAGLGVARTGGSPTFTLLWEYEGRIPVYHWDVYRVDDPSDLEDLGCEEYFFGETGVNLVEWADRVRELWPDEVLEIALSYGAGPQERVMAFTGAERYRPLLEELAHAGFGL